MSMAFFIELERRASKGAWERVKWSLPRPKGKTKEPGFDPYEFYDRTFFYVLTGETYRLDPGDCPAPMFVRPRGVPSDPSPYLANVDDEVVFPLHWMYPYEVLLYDWCEYEQFFHRERRRFEQRYEERNGHPFRRRRALPEHYAPVEFLDAVAQLEPTDGYRLVFGME